MKKQKQTNKSLHKCRMGRGCEMVTGDNSGDDCKTQRFQEKGIGEMMSYRSWFERMKKRHEEIK